MLTNFIIHLYPSINIPANKSYFQKKKKKTISLVITTEAAALRLITRSVAIVSVQVLKR